MDQPNTSIPLKEGLNTQTVEQTPEPSQKPRKVKPIYIILVVVILLLVCGGISGGIYLWSKNRAEEEKIEDQEEETGEEEDMQETEEEEEMSEESEQLPILDKTLQELITLECKKVEEQGGYSYFMDLAAFPFSIDEEMIEITDESATCATGEGLENQGSLYFHYKYSDIYIATINVYDDDSIELGHGGPPYLGEYGELITDKDTYQVSVYLKCNDTCGGTVGEYSVALRARKILKFQNGRNIYLNSDFTVFGQGNTDLEAYLNENLKNYEGTMVVDSEKVTNGLVQQFFSDIDNLQSSEKDAYNKALTFIEAIGYKT